MSNEINNFYEFGSYRLDPMRKVLLRDGAAVTLTSKAFETLLVLVQHSEQVVSKDELMKTLWPDTFVEEANLTQHISMVRRALGETPQDRRYILTLPGRGYCFTGRVRVVPQEGNHQIVDVDGDKGPAVPEPPTSNLSTEIGDKEGTQVAFWHKAVTWAALAGVSLAVIAGVVLRLGHHSGGREQTAAGGPVQKRTMLAVLPFQNLSNDPDQEYFSDGLTEETITDLGELNPEQLGLIARTSSAAYKHTNKTVAQIGRELGVDYVLEGSVRREGGVVRISAQLIRVHDQVHLWAHNYDRETGGLLAVENELGRAIAQQVQVKLPQPKGDRPAHKYAVKPEAYELYLKGRFYLNKRTWPEIDESTEYFQGAIEKDPGFALAYAGLAASYLANAISSEQEFDPKAKAAATRALELDDDLSEAHAVLGAVKADFEYDWPGAEQEFKRAIDLNPNDADAHFRYAWNYLTPLGKSEQAISEMKKALELDPFSRIDNTVFALTYFYGRRYDKALGQFQKAIELNPDFFVTYYHLAWLYAQVGQYPDAITALTEGRIKGYRSIVKIATSDEVSLRKALEAEGANGFWREIQRQNQREDPQIGEFAIPQVDARLGNKEKALEGLERNYDERASLATLVNVDPAFDSLRSDPRFESLIRRMGLTSK